MKSRLQQLQQSTFLAYTVPLFFFVGFLSLLPLVEEKHSLAPWWRQYPEHWLYPLQAILATVLLWFWRKQYRFGKSSAAEWGWGIFLGVLAGVLWVLPCELWHRLELEGKEASAMKLWLPLAGEHPWFYFFGVDARAEGFDPNQAPYPYWLALLLRFFRAVVVVSLVEEIFWRGFLMRKLAEKDGEDWQEVPIGRPRLLAWAVVTGLAILAHQPVDWVSSLCFFSFGYLLCVWRKSVLSCIIFHAATNLVMGIYAIVSGHSGLW